LLLVFAEIAVAKSTVHLSIATFPHHSFPSYLVNSVIIKVQGTSFAADYTQVAEIAVAKTTVIII